MKEYYRHLHITDNSDSKHPIEFKIDCEPYEVGVYYTFTGIKPVKDFQQCGTDTLDEYNRLMEDLIETATKCGATIEKTMSTTEKGNHASRN